MCVLSEGSVYSTDRGEDKKGEIVNERRGVVGRDKDWKGESPVLPVTDCSRLNGTFE